MSEIKSLPNNFIPSCYINDNNINNNISSNLQAECIEILNAIQNQLFFDQDLTYEHRMYILNRRHTIESDFITMLHDRINQLNIDIHIRERLATNLNGFNSSFNNVDLYTDIRDYFGVNHDSDEESYFDPETDDTYVNLQDCCDDLENLILDDIEFEDAIDNYYH
ncbi:unnamed protein product [Adineta steineri]|uniref:Uncharacterized protein n=2 Tax=Adineta steineri TaxID=433720 RepID=A0A815U4S4_9BILA|nr:unnamed protein product [Adineta steineri]